MDEQELIALRREIQKADLGQPMVKTTTLRMQNVMHARLAMHAMSMQVDQAALVRHLLRVGAKQLLDIDLAKPIGCK